MMIFFSAKSLLFSLQGILIIILSAVETSLIWTVIRQLTHDETECTVT